MATTVGTLKPLVKNYLQTAFPASGSPFGSTSDATTVDTLANTLILQAFNNARKFAELKCDFHYADVTVGATIPAGSNVALTGLTDYYGSGGSWSLKSVRNVYRKPLATDEFKGLIPLEFMTQERLAHELKKVSDAKAVGYRYRDGHRMDDGYDAGVTYWSDQRNSTVVFQNNSLSLFPPSTEDLLVVIDGNRWLSDYTGDSDTDFILERGPAYMLWAATCEVNLLFQTFVYRQEGSLQPPTNERDAALQALMDWDSYLTVQGDLPERD